MQKLLTGSQSSEGLGEDLRTGRGHEGPAHGHGHPPPPGTPFQLLTPNSPSRSPSKIHSVLLVSGQEGSRGSLPAQNCVSLPGRDVVHGLHHLVPFLTRSPTQSASQSRQALLMSHHPLDTLRVGDRTPPGDPGAGSCPLPPPCLPVRAAEDTRQDGGLSSGHIRRHLGCLVTRAARPHFTSDESAAKPLSPRFGTAGGWVLSEAKSRRLEPDLRRHGSALVPATQNTPCGNDRARPVVTAS